MARRHFPLLIGRGIVWSGIRVALLVLSGLLTLHFLGQGFANRLERHRSNRSALAGIDDWSHHRLVFSQPSDSRQVLQLQREPRFWHQWNLRGGASIARIVAAASPAPAGSVPAKFSSNVSSSNCATETQPDFVVFNTGLAGDSSRAGIVAYDDLYSSCTGSNRPGVYWQYNTGGAVKTSVILSADGSQIAFVQSSGANAAASLVVLKWSGRTAGGAPLTTLTSNPSYPDCGAPCMIVAPFRGGKDDSYSSPFYDYTRDVLYVGDDNGALHKFTNIFNGGSPAEWGSPFATVSPGRKLASPVYDSTSGNVFVGDSAGIFHSYSASGVRIGTSVPLADGANIGITEPPLIDSTAGKVYVFAVGAVYQFAATFTSGAGLKVSLSSIHGDALYQGALDDIYFSTTKALSLSGRLYLCASGLHVVPKAHNAPPGCSATADIPSGASDWIVMSVTAKGIQAAAGPAPCAADCAYAFNAPSGAGSGSAAAGSSDDRSAAAGSVVPSNPATQPQNCFTTFRNQTCASR